MSTLAASPTSIARPDILVLDPYEHAAWNPQLERLHVLCVKRTLFVAIEDQYAQRLSECHQRDAHARARLEVKANVAGKFLNVIPDDSTTLGKSLSPKTLRR